MTVASRIHILEPQWNPAVEDQAIGRAVRIGQEQNATIIRYMVENSVEQVCPYLSHSYRSSRLIDRQQIQTYQRRKRNLVAGGFGETAKHLDVENKILKVRLSVAGRKMRRTAGPQLIVTSLTEPCREFELIWTRIEYSIVSAMLVVWVAKGL